MATPFPALFVGHGNPMNALQDNADTQTWRTLAAGLAKPRAILAISAHWFTPALAVTAMARPETIHDLYGFPQALAEFQYPAPGDPGLARRLVDLLTPESVNLDTGWGLDHGTWSVLAHMYPDADIPVVQLSLDSRLDGHAHIELARKLTPLREEGILILGSGNIVHNLRRMDWHHPDGAYDWASRFTMATRAALQADDLDTLAAFAYPDSTDDDARQSVPTPEHYLPLLYIAALRTRDEPLSFFNDRIAYGSIDMTGIKIG